MPSTLRSVLAATVSSGIGIGVFLLGTAVVLQDPARPSWMLALPLLVAALPVQIAWMAMERMAGGRAGTTKEGDGRKQVARRVTEPSDRRIEPVFERTGSSASVTDARIDPVLP